MTSTTRTYTITEALQEIKLLSNRIQSGIDGGVFINVYRSDSNTDPEAIAKGIAPRLQSIKDMIERRARIKAAIMQSNALTQVEIGGKMYTVAEAISTKEFIKDQRDLLDTLKSNKVSAENQLARFNTERQNKIDDLINRSFGREGTNKQNPEDIKSITDIYMKKNYMTMVDPINIDKEIEQLEEHIETFSHQVDFKLSYINAITTIQVTN